MRLLTKRLRLTIEVCVLSLKGSRNCSLHDPSFVLKTQEGGHQSLQEPWQHWRRVLRSQALQPVTWQQSLPVVLWDVWRAPALHWESEDHILGASSKCMQSNRHMIYIYITLVTGCFVYSDCRCVLSWKCPPRIFHGSTGCFCIPGFLTTVKQDTTLTPEIRNQKLCIVWISW